MNPSQPAVGLGAIAAYVPQARIDLLQHLGEYQTDEQFLKEKTGCLSLARRAPDEDTTDLAERAVRSLEERRPGTLAAIGLLIVVTQNAEGHGLPHASARLHGRLGLAPEVAAFDISLGCSGWVYGLSIAKSFMEANGIENGLLVTSDPYSKVLRPGDRDTNLLFGDAATASLLTASAPEWRIGRFVFGTDGSKANALEIDAEGHLRMNGRSVFMFSATQVPPAIKETLRRNGLSAEDVDLFMLHQGSRYIVRTIGDRLGAADKAPFVADRIGNTVSSTIPLAIAEGHCAAARRVVVAGFGVGLSWSATVLERP